MSSIAYNISNLMGYYLCGLRSFTVDFLSYPNFIGKMPHQVLNSTGEIHTRATHCHVGEKPSWRSVFHRREEHSEGIVLMSSVIMSAVI